MTIYKDYIETFKRLYSKGLVTSQKLVAIKSANKITQEEYDYILL